MNLTDGLAEHLQTITPPPPDLDQVVRTGTLRRRARRAAQAAGVLLTVGVLAGTTLLVRDGGASSVVEPPPLSTGPMDLSNGLRAFGDPGRVVSLGGRTLPAKDLEGLDVTAAATSEGIVYFRSGRPWLLTAGGSSRSLWDGEAEPGRDFHPTAKSDAESGDVVFAVRSASGEVTVVVRSLTEDRGFGLPLDCDAEPGCKDLVIDGIDSGVVFVRTDTGTYQWRYAGDDKRDELMPFAGRETRVADVQNKTVLYDGPRPTVTLEGWDYVPGAIDAQLTRDGWNVLYWSPVLESVRPNGEAIRLDVPKSAQWFIVDTDGSILAATAEDPARFFDCEVPSGACEQIGELRITGGDPQFIGNDM